MTREEAIELVKSAFDAWEYKYDTGDDWSKEYEARDMAIESLEQTLWIPVSEKLPNDRDWYLGIFKEPDTGWINPLPFVCDYVGHETKATTKEHWILRGFTDRDEHIDYYFNLECVAWMQLPKPYKAESEVEVAEEQNKAAKEWHENQKW